MSLSVPLQEIATRLVTTNKQLPEPNFACVAVAGGGGHAISALASTPGASSLFLEGTITYDRNSFHAYVGECLEDEDEFRYASEEAAKLLSRAAVRRALQYRANLDEYPRCIGVGISSALKTTKERTKGSFGFLVATLADGTQWKCQVTLKPNSRSRVEEDQLMGSIVLQSIEQLNTQGQMKIQLDEGDSIEEDFSAVQSEDPVKEAAERILSDECKAVLLLPVEGENRFKAVTDPVLPMESLVFPGSFNPPHYGHTKLAQAASVAWKGSSSAVFLELSLTNPDKPSMDPVDVSERAHRFFQLQDQLPSQWGILLTSAPLFAQKVGVLRPFMAQVRSTGPQLGFVIGTDTMVRILNPKYYGDDKENMLEAIREMGRSGVHFVVGGRLEQRKDNVNNNRFVTGQEEVDGLPKDVQKMFTLVTEEDFRVDISSTEIRKQMAAQAQAEAKRRQTSNL